MRFAPQVLYASLFAAACGGAPQPPRAHVSDRAQPAPVHEWSNRALHERCERARIAASEQQSAAPTVDASPPPVRRVVELPPALARYPLLGRLSTGCGSPTLQTYCSMASTPWSLPEMEPPPHGPLVMMFGDARDCVTQSALGASLDRDQLAACFDGASLPCGRWYWVSASIRVDAPHEGRLVAMSGHEAVSVETANCLSRAFRATHWVEHESAAPVLVNVAIAWTDQACFR